MTTLSEYGKLGHEQLQRRQEMNAVGEFQAGACLGTDLGLY